jgi:hypothetical protein
LPVLGWIPRVRPSFLQIPPAHSLTRYNRVSGVRRLIAEVPPTGEARSPRSSLLRSNFSLYRTERTYLIRRVEHVRLKGTSK